MTQDNQFTQKEGTKSSAVSRKSSLSTIIEEMTLDEWILDVRNKEKSAELKDINARALAKQSKDSKARARKLIPIEQMLADTAIRPLTDFPMHGPKPWGRKDGFIAQTTLEKVKTTKGVKIKREADGAVSQVLPGTTTSLPLESPLQSLHMVKSYKNSIDTIREYIASPLYEKLLPGSVAKVRLIKEDDQEWYTRSQFLDGFKTIAEVCGEIGADKSKMVAHPVSGFEKAFVAVAIMGEIDLHMNNLGIMFAQDGNKIAKVDHGHALCCFSNNIEELIFYMRDTFFDASWTDYTIVIEENIVTFNMQILIDEIDLACSKLADRDDVLNILTQRVKELEKQGVKFDTRLTETSNQYFDRTSEQGGISNNQGDVVSAISAQNLIEFYTNSILQQAQVMKEMSRYIKAISSLPSQSHHARSSVDPCALLDAIMRVSLNSAPNQSPQKWSDKAAKQEEASQQRSSVHDK